MALKILYLALADARGHLMRAQLLAHALAAEGVQVEVVTTKREGQEFLSSFGIDARLLSPKPHFQVHYDAQQNMQRSATDRHVAAYMLLPGRMWRDLWVLCRMARDAQLVVNDSFHLALMLLGALPGWRRKVVHVYGRSLIDAVVTNFDGRSARWLSAFYRHQVLWMLRRSRAQLEHDFAYPLTNELVSGRYRLPTPIKVVQKTASPGKAQAAVYLNPFFQDDALAAALEQGLAAAGMSAYCVGSGYAHRAGWLSEDTQWVDRAAQAPLIVSAPGMAAISVAHVYGRPLVLVHADQPEQTANIRRAAELGLAHRVVAWRGNAVRFGAEVAQACRDLLGPAACPHGVTGEPEVAGEAAAEARLALWVDTLIMLAQAQVR